MAHKSGKSHESEETRPDSQLLPLAKRMLVGLTAFFFLASLGQLVYLHTQIEKTPELKLEEFLKTPSYTTLPKQDRLPLVELKSRARIEVYALKRRYHQGNVLLMSRIWISYLSFVTGMILSLVGASFILSKVREPTTTLDAESKVFKFSVASSSPGIILAILGTLLIITSIVTNHRIEIIDQSVYLQAYQGGGNIPSPIVESTTPDNGSESDSESDDKTGKSPQEKVNEALKLP